MLRTRYSGAGITGIEVICDLVHHQKSTVYAALV